MIPYGWSTNHSLESKTDDLVVQTVVVALVAMVVGSLLEQGLALEQDSQGVGAGKRRPPSLRRLSV